jgi:aldehyde:ferredoxin oxidoreductase
MTNELRILRVDLTNREITKSIFPENLTRKYLGGWNLIAHILLSEMRPGIEPLSPENILVFATGILTGVPIGCCARSSVGAKGPLTGGFAESEAGGYLPAELRFTGYDAVVFYGRASSPVYLSILEGEAELHDAADLWGKTIGEAHDRICERHGDKLIRSAMIGPAGENQVKIACIMNDISHAYGRGGIGAVMGSKNLKAVAVRGRQKLKFHDPGKIKGLAKWFNDTWESFPTADFWAKHGSIGMLSSLDAAGALPTRNFKAGSFSQAEQISGEALSETNLVGRGSCYACSIRCKREVSMDEPYKVDVKYGGPEYESASALGSNCGVSDLGVLLKANELCNAYGLDTISAGATIAWAMECYQAGLISTGDCDGLELKFGSADAMLTMVEKIARRSGFGEILGNGAARAADLLGVGQEFAMHVKKQDFPMHEPRVKHGLGLSYAVSPTGADHMHAIHDVSYVNPESPAFNRIRELGVLEPLPATQLSPAKVRMTVYETLLGCLYNDLVICNAARQPFRYDIDKLLGAINGVTGWGMKSWEVIKVAERSLTMARAFNLREGLSVEDDDLPKRMFQKLEGSPNSVPLNPVEFQESLALYYEMLGWDGLRGIPTRGKLEELDIGWVWDYVKERMEGHA